MLHDYAHVTLAIYVGSYIANYIGDGWHTLPTYFTMPHGSDATGLDFSYILYNYLLT